MSAAEDIRSQPYQLVLVPAEKLPQVLGMVVPKLEEIVKRSNGLYTVPGIIDKIASGTWQLWVVWNGSVQAVFATELYVEMSGVKTCQVANLAGENVGHWIHLMAELEEWARSEGCQRMYMIARKGWARKLPDYKMPSILLEKDLT